MQNARAPGDGPERPAPPSAKQTSLVGKAVRGAFWSVLSGTGARVITILGTLTVTHYLSPQEYGEVSIAALVMLTANTFANLGVSQYIASKPHAERAAVFHATFYYLLLGMVVMGAAVLLGGPFGRYLSAPHIGRFLPILAGAVLIDRVVTIQDRIQVRDMRFRAIGLNRALGDLVYSATSILLAATCRGTIFGGPYALAWAMVARSSIRVVTLAAITPRREWAEPHRITLAETRELFGFGLPMSLAGMANFGSSKFDNFVYSHHFGEAAVGTYNLAYNFADLPAALIAETVGDVLVPSFAHMDSDERRKVAFLVALEMLVFLVTPLALGLAVVAPELVAVAFAPSYSAIAGSLRILVLLSVPRTIIWTGISYLQVCNRPRVIMVLEWLRLFGIVTIMNLFIIVARRVVGDDVAMLVACGAVVSVFALSALTYMVALRRLDGVTVADQIRPLLPPALACVPMLLAVEGVRRFLVYVAPLKVDLPLTTAAQRALTFGPRLALEVIVGVIVFIPSALLLARGTSRRLLGMVSSARQRRRSVTPVAPVGEGL